MHNSQVYIGYCLFVRFFSSALCYQQRCVIAPGKLILAQRAGTWCNNKLWLLYYCAHYLEKEQVSELAAK